METHLTQPKKHSTAIRRNTDLQARLYSRIASISTSSYYPQTTRPDSFLCRAELVYRRKYIGSLLDFESRDVFLPNSNDRIVRLRPAIGELLRKPTTFVAVVLVDNNPKVSRVVTIGVWQDLVVI